MYLKNNSSHNHMSQIGSHAADGASLAAAAAGKSKQEPIQGREYIQCNTSSRERRKRSRADETCESGTCAEKRVNIREREAQGKVVLV